MTNQRGLKKHLSAEQKEESLTGVQDVLCTVFENGVIWATGMQCILGMTKLAILSPKKTLSMCTAANIMDTLSLKWKMILCTGRARGGP